jgi:hypothetical protein
MLWKLAQCLSEGVQATSNEVLINKLELCYIGYAPHREQNYGTLWSNIDIGLGSRPFDSSGGRGEQ